MRLRARQRGFTLVELLVSSTIMVVILSALGSLFIGTNRAYRVNEEVSERQQSADAAAQLLSYEIGLAGYRGSTQVANSNTFAGSTLLLTKGASDTIEVRYYEDRNATSVDELIVTFSVSSNTFYRKQLKEKDTQATKDATTRQPAIQNVKNLKVVGYILNNGKEYPRDPAVTHAWIEPYTLTSDITPYTLVALKLELTFTDDLKKRVVIGIDNPQQIPPSQTPFLPEL